MNIGPVELTGQNVFLNLSTDHGKSLIFNVFQLQRRLFSKDLEVPVSVYIVVISRLRALMKDQACHLNDIPVPLIQFEVRPSWSPTSSSPDRFNTSETWLRFRLWVLFLTFYLLDKSSWFLQFRQAVSTERGLPTYCFPLISKLSR